MRQRVLSFVALSVLPSGVCLAQVGPDLINASLNDIARHGTNAAGTIIGYSSGNVTCNHGDAPMAASPTTTIRPIVAMSMYRLKSFGTYSRFEQVGQGWCKWVSVPVNGTNAACGGPCTGGGSGFMGVNCADLYSSGFNSPNGMAPRSAVNPTTGALIGSRGGGTGETNINTRVQVATSDVTAQPVGTRFFFETVELLPHDATHVRPGQTVAVNAMNNATTNEININGGTAAPSLMGAPSYLPAIARWKDIDPSVTIFTADHDDYPNPNASFPGTTIRSRFYIAAKATSLPGGLWRYEYAIFNLNSDRAAGAFTIPFAPGGSMSDFNFRHPPSHSGEPYSNAAWTTARNGSALSMATDPFVVNPNANAIRWGTTYNLGFTTNVGPRTGNATLTLFKPGATTSITVSGVPAPAPSACAADINVDTAVTIDDLLMYVDFLSQGSVLADLDNGSGEGTGDGGVTIDDLLFFLDHYAAGC
jgi:hypothetical protein